jgi:K+-transporting ATPase c subunit
MTLNPTETARIAALQAKPVAQQTQLEKNELAALVAKQNS